MSAFPLCPGCAQEYADPTNRRFHAQTIACPACGPRLSLCQKEGKVLAQDDDALRKAEETLVAGGIVALKGVGGFQLLVDARNEDAVQRLRKRKGREAKPFAILVRDRNQASELCHGHDAEWQILDSPKAPIVLLPRRQGVSIASAVALDLPWLGLMLPASPLHYLIAHDLGIPLVATSGNRSEEPLCTDDAEAFDRLRDIADVFLTHDRAIARPLDDSVVQVVDGRPMVLRRARGYVPEPLPCDLPAATLPWLAVGGHLKNTVALSVGDKVVMSQHLGDLDSPAAREGFTRAIGDYLTLFQVEPAAIICDAHPDYASTVWAEEQAAARGIPLYRVQHHQAHVFACMAEHGLDGPALGVTWDGTGHGDDGTIWGGEFFLADKHRCRRLASLLPFPLLGGDAAARQPRRSALGVLWTVFGEEALERCDLPSVRSFATSERSTLKRLFRQRVGAVMTSSMGRLFDAVASLLDLCHVSRYEGEAAMRLQAVAGSVETIRNAVPYPFYVSNEERIDWRPMIHGLLADRDQPGLAAARFHATLAEIIATVAERTRMPTVVLGGGCFQNRLLLEAIAARLGNDGRRVFWPQDIPTNDGGLSLGQIAAVVLGHDSTEDQACASPCRAES
jgi:hydrogenase maturation protein HypF